MSNDSWKHRSVNMSCVACMWFTFKELNPENNKPMHVGRCRRHAPTMNDYPVVFGTDWCGDHKLDENAV